MCDTGRNKNLHRTEKKSNYYSKQSSFYYSTELNVQNWYELLPILASTQAFLAWDVLHHKKINRIPLLLVLYALRAIFLAKIARPSRWCYGVKPKNHRVFLDHKVCRKMIFSESCLYMAMQGCILMLRVGAQKSI